MKCHYCEGKVPLLRFGDEGYPYRKDFGPTFTCVPCQAWVGCHPGTEKPLGRLADAQLRAAKQAAHAAFDPLWKRVVDVGAASKTKARKTAYRWLAAQLGISPRHTHMGHMDLEQCRRVIEICNAPPQLLRAGPAGVVEHIIEGVLNT